MVDFLEGERKSDAHGHDSEVKSDADKPSPDDVPSGEDLIKGVAAGRYDDHFLG